ncbi:MAG: hypothetical protein JXQ66_01615, partial [Campylobacterales bacterium]|nr:hypothetical protein [Campylobacterales bacterium]
HIVLKNLSSLILESDFSEVPISVHSNFIIQLHRLRENLTKWRTTIFIDESAADIHHLDQAIFSASLQIETMLNNVKDDLFEDFNNMEFF